MESGDPVIIVGTTIVVVGFVVECIAMSAIAYYPLRRCLPARSPLVLQSWGCILFYLGVLVLFGRAVVK